VGVFSIVAESPKYITKYIITPVKVLNPAYKW
jgi:hypothetical protein